MRKSTGGHYNWSTLTCHPWPLQRLFLPGKTHLTAISTLMLLYIESGLNCFLFFKKGTFLLYNKRKIISCILYSVTEEVKSGYAAALFLTLTLLLTPIETVCQSNHAPSQTSPRVECSSTFSTMLHCSLHIAYPPQRGRGFNKKTIR